MTDEVSAIAIEVAQRTPEWFAQRVGKATASRIHHIITRTKTGWGAKREDYAADLVIELLTGLPAPSFKSPEMQWGIDNEAAGRDAYRATVFEEVTEAGFVIHPAISDAGASPDGYVGENGLVEIKCPKTSTHIEAITKEYIQPQYLTQMQFQMACTGRKWCDFCSYDPRMPEGLQLWVKRIERDDLFIAQTETMVKEFLAEVHATVEQLRSKIKVA